jgi:hypothetical protein
MFGSVSQHIHNRSITFCSLVFSKMNLFSTKFRFKFNCFVVINQRAS